MKPALILGLALAANAMTADSDNNELFVAPTGKLAEFAKKHPGIMFDEQADNELYRGNLPREAFKSDEEYRRYIFKRSSEEADDEFLVRPLSTDDEELFVAPQGKLADLAKKYPGMIMFDEQADDELAVMIAPRSRFNSDEEYEKYKLRMRHSWDDAADDELAVRLLPRDHFKTEEEYQKYYNRARFTLDDAADDELGLKIVHLPTAEPVAFDDDELWGGIGFDGKGTPSFGRRFDPKQWKSPQGQYPKLVADDELAIMIAPRSRFSSDEEYEKYKISMRRSFDDAADDELVVMIASRSRFSSDEEYEKYKISMRRSFDDAADEELFFNPPQFLSQNPTDVYGRILRDSRGLPIQPIPARFDEVADDELGLKIVQFPVEHVAFDDDELGVVAPPRKPRSSFGSDEEYQKYLAHKRAHRNFDDAADDELIFNPPQFLSQNPTDVYGRILRDSRGLPIQPLPARFDDAADDEFAINQQIVQLPAEFVAFDDDELMSGIPPVSNFKSYEEWLRFTRRMSEEADNELGVKYVHLPVEHVAYDDDEFYVPIVLAKYDEVADDELAYLGHLLNERAQSRSFDESKKAEKPSHGKTKERTQMKRKLRPVVDETPLAQI